MDQPVPVFDKELQVLDKARRSLTGLGYAALSQQFGELVAEYELLLDRSRRVAAMACSVQEDLEAAMAQVSQLSQVDGLTGAMNQRAFEKLLAHDWAKAQREGAPLSMLVVNIDTFRAYNEIHGSLKGDDCLKLVAQSLMRSLYREVDVVARMEDDTFVALLPGTDAHGARVVAQRIVDEVRALGIPHLESPHGGVVTVSAGVATVAPAPADAPMLLVRQAQAALGDAKDQGRNRVSQYSDQPAPEVE